MLILFADLAWNDNELKTAGAATLNETDEKTEWHDGWVSSNAVDERNVRLGR